MATNKYLIGFLVLVVLSASVYILLPEKVRIDVENTHTTFKVYEDGSWVLSGTEYTKLYDGTTLMRANNRVVNYTVDLESNKSTIFRYAYFKDGIVAIDTYEFDGNTESIENVPVSHEIRVFNGQGKILVYEVNDLLYTGETIKEVASPQSFGHNMKVEWESGNYYSRIWKYVNKDVGKLEVKYRIDSDDYSKNVRLFDPSEISLEYDKKIVFNKLISETVDLTYGESIFEIKNPNDLILKDLLSIEFEGTDGKEITSYELFINCSRKENITLYKNVLISKECSNNESKSYDCSYYEEIPNGYQINILEDWCKLDNYEVKEGVYKIKLVAYWKAKLGESSVDWIPTLIVPKELSGTSTDLIISQDKWAWWNASWSYKQPILINSTVTSTLANFPAYFIFDSASLILAGKMNNTCKDLRIVNGSEDTAYNFEVVGCNTTTTTVFLSYPSFNSGNQTVYMYYGNPIVNNVNNYWLVWQKLSNLRNVYHLESNVTPTIDARARLNGTYSGNGTLINAHYSKGINWTGGINNYVSIARTTDVGMLIANSSQSWYISARVNSGSTVKNLNAVFSDYHTTNSHGPVMWMRNDGCGIAPGGGNKICAVIINSAGAGYYVVDPANFTINTKYYIGLASNNTGTYLIKDGIIVNFTAQPNQKSDNGGFKIANDWSTDRNFNGYIDEFRIYNSTPTVDWIRAEYGQLYWIGSEEGQTPPEDICTYTSGNWAILFSDYCNITSNVAASAGTNNLTITGIGIFTTTANITGFKNIRFSGTAGQSTVRCLNAGCFR